MSDTNRRLKDIKALIKKKHKHSKKKKHRTENSQRDISHSGINQTSISHPSINQIDNSYQFIGHNGISQVTIQGHNDLIYRDSIKREIDQNDFLHRDFIHNDILHRDNNDMNHRDTLSNHDVMHSDFNQSETSSCTSYKTHRGQYLNFAPCTYGKREFCLFTALRFSLDMYIFTIDCSFVSMFPAHLDFNYSHMSRYCHSLHTFQDFV